MNKLFEQDVCFALRKCHNIVGWHYNKALLELGLTYQQMGIMIEMLKDENLSLETFASFLGIDRSTLTRNVKLLKNCGYISELPTKDKRIKKLKLTGEGKYVAEKSEEVLLKVQSYVNSSIESLIKPEVLINDLNNISKTIGSL